MSATVVSKLIRAAVISPMNVVVTLPDGLVAICVGLAVLGAFLYFFSGPHTAAVQYTQLTDFDDSAAVPALSPDGRMLAFFCSEESFVTADQIWLKLLPNGEAKRPAHRYNRNYLGEMNQDSSGRRRVLPYPIVAILGISPARRWMFIAKEVGGRNQSLAVSLKGDPPRTFCNFPCYSEWSANGKWLFVPVVHASGNDPGRSLAIPIGPDETLPPLPAEGIQLGSPPSIIPGAQSINRESLVPGLDPSQYAYLKGGVHRNLCRVTLP